MAEPFLGQIQTFGFNFAPRGWAQCNGQLLPISQNTALFSLLGTTYGGDGRTTFALPDLRGRFPTHVGSGPGLSPKTLGQKGGSETHQLTVNQLASHNHIANISVSTIDGEETSPQDKVLAKHDAAYTEDSTPAALLKNSATSSNTGGGQSVNHMPPFLVLNWCIALQGTFPSRN